MQNRCQAITCTNSDPVYWCIYAALGRDELIHIVLQIYHGNFSLKIFTMETALISSKSELYSKFVDTKLHVNAICDIWPQCVYWELTDLTPLMWGFLLLWKDNHQIIFLSRRTPVVKKLSFFYLRSCNLYIDGLVQERHNSIVLAVE